MPPAVKMDEPVVLSTNMRVSAKFRGAYCEARIINVDVDVPVQVSRSSDGALVTVPIGRIQGVLRVGESVYVRPTVSSSSGGFHAIVRNVKDNSSYTVVFNDGDQITVKRRFLLLNPDTSASTRTSSQERPGHSSRYSRSVDEIESRTHESGAEGIGHTLAPGVVVLAKSRHGFFPALILEKEAEPDCVFVKSFCTDEEIKVSVTDVSILDREKLEQIRFLLPGFDMTPVENHMKTCPRPEPAHPTADDFDINLPSSDDECLSNKDYFLANLINFLEASGMPLSDIPTVDGKPCDLCALYRIVDKNGGCQRVSKRRLWPAIHAALGLPSTSPNAGSEVEQIYKRYLLSFYEMNRKLGSPTIAPDRRSRFRESKSSQRLFKPSSSVLRSRRVSIDTSTYLRGSASAKVCLPVTGISRSTMVRRTTESSTGISRRRSSPRLSRARTFVQCRSLAASKSSVDTYKSPSRSRRGESEALSACTSTSQWCRRSRLRPRRKATKRTRPARKKRAVIPATTTGQSSNDSSLCSQYSHVSSGVLESISLPDKFTIDQIEKQSFVKVLWSNAESEREVYKAKVLEKDTEKDLVYVHYVGWNSRYDQWVTLNRILAINCVPPGRRGASRSFRSQELVSTPSSRATRRFRSRLRPKRKARGSGTEAGTVALVRRETEDYPSTREDPLLSDTDAERRSTGDSSPQPRREVTRQTKDLSPDDLSVYSTSDTATGRPCRISSRGSFRTEFKDGSGDEHSFKEVKMSDDSEGLAETPSDHHNLIRLDSVSSPDLLKQRLERVLPNRLRITREELLAKLGIDPVLLDENASAADLRRSLSARSFASSQSVAYSDDERSSTASSSHVAPAAHGKSTASQDLQRALVAIGNRADLIAGSRYQPDVRSEGQSGKGDSENPCIDSPESRSRLYRQAANSLNASLVRVQAMYQVVKEQYDLKLAEWEAKYNVESNVSSERKGC